MNAAKEECSQCGKIVPLEELMEEGCPWCGWESAKAKKRGVEIGGIDVR